MLRIIMVIGKMKEKEREYGYYGNRKMKKRGKGAQIFRFMDLWKGKKTHKLF